MARYAYWVEDMEAYLDAAVAGNDRGGTKHARANEPWAGDWPGDWPMDYPEVDARYTPPWPAPGLNPGALDDEPVLNQIAVWTLDKPAARVDQTDFDERVRENREFARSGESLIAAMEIPAPLKRDEDGHLLDEDGRLVEENLGAGNRPYEERPVIPFVEGIAEDMVGEPQLNLNELLGRERSAAVSEMAAHLKKALPDFGTVRKGGFPEDYEETLMASTLDYADEDGDASVAESSYRGVDSYPLVNEFLSTVTWQWRQHPDDGALAAPGALTGKSFHRQNGRVYILFTVELFAELWNMTSQRCEGEFSVNYDFGFLFAVGPIPSPPGLSFMDPSVLDRPIESIDPKSAQSGSNHALIKEGERYFFPPMKLSLDGNDHRLVRLGSVHYMFDVGPSFLFLPDSTEMTQVSRATSEYRLRWNGKLVDWSRGKIERWNLSKVEVGKGAYTRANVCGTYGLTGTSYHTGMGDVRQTYYSDQPVSSNTYPLNYSPNRRNVRYGTIYKGNQEKVWGRVIPSEWPDGGHDASFDLQTFHKAGRGEKNKWPDDARFVDPQPTPEPDKAPLRISNMGRFLSESELGHVTDPVMWARRVPLWAAVLSGPGRAGRRAGVEGRPCEHQYRAAGCDPGLGCGGTGGGQRHFAGGRSA